MNTQDEQDFEKWLESEIYAMCEDEADKTNLDGYKIVLAKYRATKSGMVRELRERVKELNSGYSISWTSREVARLLDGILNRYEGGV